MSQPARKKKKRAELRRTPGPVSDLLRSAAVAWLRFFLLRWTEALSYAVKRAPLSGFRTSSTTSQPLP